MQYYDEQLKELQEKVSKKNRFDYKLEKLYSQQSELKEKVRELEHRKFVEQDDVDKLEGRSLAAFFYSVIGKMDEKLDKERQEAYAAAVKYDAAYAELQAVEEDIRSIETELRDLKECENLYEKTLKDKAESVKASGGADSAEILKFEEKLSYIRTQQKELEEAISAGEAALETAEYVLSELDSAEGWSTWDLMGGGVLTDIMKHEKLDNAQNEVENLQVLLGKFKTELADVTIHADIQVSMDGFTRFADFFFDGLFTDWMVMDKISQSKSQVQETITEIEDVLTKLDEMIVLEQQEEAKVKAELDELILRA